MASTQEFPNSIQHILIGSDICTLLAPGASSPYLRFNGAHTACITRQCCLLEHIARTAYLGLKAHVQHAVSLVQHQVGDLVQEDLPGLQEVIQTPRCGNNNLHAALEVTQLGALWGATIHTPAACESCSQYMWQSQCACLSLGQLGALRSISHTHLQHGRDHDE